MPPLTTSMTVLTCEVVPESAPCRYQRVNFTTSSPRPRDRHVAASGYFMCDIWVSAQHPRDAQPAEVPYPDRSRRRVTGVAPSIARRAAADAEIRPFSVHADRGPPSRSTRRHKFLRPSNTCKACPSSGSPSAPPGRASALPVLTAPTPRVAGHVGHGAPAAAPVRGQARSAESPTVDIRRPAT